MTGGFDWIWKVDKDQAESIRSAPNLTVKDAETMRIGYVTFDAAGKAGASPVNNPKVRQAIAYAVNRKSIVENLFAGGARSEEHTSELQSLMRISYAVFCLKTKKKNTQETKY